MLDEGETTALTLGGINDELERSAELCEDTSLVNTDTITETEKVEAVLDERDCSEEEYPVEVVVGTMLLTDGDGDVVVLEGVGDAEAELPPEVPEGVPPKLKYP